MSKLSGVPKEKLVELAELYADPKKKIISFWTMGFNQHTRGTWVNEQIYMIHLLGGKMSTPGSGAFSLTGQPSACGTAREVGTFAHRLPSDMVVANKGHRDKSREALEAAGQHAEPEGRDPRREDGAQPAQRSGEVLLGAGHESLPGFRQRQRVDPAAREKDNFIVVSDCYPTVSAKVADLVLPVAMIYEKWGAYGNAERRTQHWRQQVKAPGESKGDLWQILEFSKRFKLKEVWKEQPLARPEGRGLRGRQAARRARREAKAMGYDPEQTLYEVLFAHAGAEEVRLARSDRRRASQRHRRGLRLLRPQGAVAGVPAVRPRQRPRPGGLRHLSPGAGPALAGGQRPRDPVALPRGLRPLREAG